MRVAYFDLGFSKEDYSVQPRRYGGGAVVARYLKEDNECDLHVFAPEEAFENVGMSERADRCHRLPDQICNMLQQGFPVSHICSDPTVLDQFDLILHGHTCFALNRGSFRGPMVHWSGFDGAAGNPGNDYVLLYDPSFRAQFGERAKYVRIGKPVPEQWPGGLWDLRERFVFQCSRHDDHLNTIALAKQCLAEGFRGVFAGPIHNGYPLLDYIDGKTTVYLGEIDEATKLDYCRRAGLYGMLHAWDAMPFNQSIIEAQGQGTPIYTYPKGPFLKTYLQHKHNGFDANVYNLSCAWIAADADVSYASWKAAREYDVSVMCRTFKTAFTEIVSEWRAEHPSL